MRNIASYAVSFRLIFAFIGLSLILFGAKYGREMSFDRTPEYGAPMVIVQTEALGLPALEVEALITVPLEEMLSGLPWLDEMRSHSVNSLSSVEIQFEPGTDLIDARQMVQERMGHAAALPNVSKPPSLLQPVASENRVINIALSSQEMSLVDLSVLAEWKLKPSLMGVNGVANVAIWGQRKRQLQVRVDPETLNGMGVELYDVVEAVGNGLWVTPLSFLNASTPGNGGFIDTPNQRLDIRHVLPISSPGDLEKIVVQGSDGIVQTLGSVAQVVEGPPPLVGDAVFNGSSSLVLVVEKFPWASSADVARDINAQLNALQASLPGVDVDTRSFSAGAFVEAAQKDFLIVLGLGWALFSLAMMLLLPVRSAIVASTVSAVAIGASLFTLGLVGNETNLVAIVGLLGAFAFIAGDLALSGHAGQADLDDSDLADASSQESSRTVTAAIGAGFIALAIAVTGAAVSPFILPVMETFGLATLVSVLVVAFLVPASAGLLRGVVASDKSFTRTFIAPALPPVSRFGGLALGSGIAVLASLGLIYTGSDFRPFYQERELVVHWSLPNNASLTETSALAASVSGALDGLDWVDTAVIQIGRAFRSDSMSDVDRASVWISLAPGTDHAEAIAEIEEELTKYPGVWTTPMSFADWRIDESLNETENEMTLRVYGPNFETMAEVSAGLGARIAELQGVVSAEIEEYDMAPHLEIDVDLAKARDLGLTPGEVRRAASILLAGLDVGTLFEDQKVFDVTVWGEEHLRTDAAAVSRIMLETPSNGMVPLEAVATVTENAAPDAIFREGASRRMDIRVSYLSGQSNAVSGAIENLVADSTFPFEYHAELKGAEENGFSTISIVAIMFAAGAGVLLILHGIIGNWSEALARLAIPLAGAGAAVLTAFVVTGLSLGSLAAVVAITALGLRLALDVRHDDRRSERPFPVIAAIGTIAFVLPAALYGSAPGLVVLSDAALPIAMGAAVAALFALLIAQSESNEKSQVPAHAPKAAVL